MRKNSRGGKFSASTVSIQLIDKKSIAYLFHQLLTQLFVINSIKIPGRHHQ